MKIYAQVTESGGTAMAETALCENHLSRKDDPSRRGTDYVDCGDNPELSCIVCGATASPTEKTT
jgi:hypothetical protein